MTVRCTIWGENIHERENEVVASIYPDGIHETIARAVSLDPDILARTIKLQDPEHGCSEDILEQTDVLVWWGHKAHDAVADQVVDRIIRHVWSGMGLIALHSAHFSKVFRRLMGTPCALRWREAGERERLWVINPGHPIAANIPGSFVLEYEEMYGEPFSVPEPLETVFVSWFQGGEVFRSGLTYMRGAGKIFYFRPGHETYPTYHDKNVQAVLCNAIKWAAAPRTRWGEVEAAPNIPVESAPEVIQARGPTIHEEGQSGFR